MDSFQTHFSRESGLAAVVSWAAQPSLVVSRATHAGGEAQKMGLSAWVDPFLPLGCRHS